MNAHKKFAIALMTLSLVLTGCEVRTVPAGSSGAAQQQLAQQQAQPTTAKVEKRDIVGYRLLSGHVYLPPNATADVIATGPAPVQTVNVKEGERVGRGQVIVTLATGQQENYQQAKSTYDAAVAAYNQALAQYEQPVRDVQRQLDQAKATEKTIRESTTPGGDATSLQQATANRKSLEDQVKVVQAQARTNELQYKTQLDQAKLALSEARAGKQQSTITAPITGTVMSLTVTPGQTFGARSVIAKIVDLPAMRIKCEVLPADVPFVKTGTAVAVVFNDFPDHKFVGRVQSLDTLPPGADGKTQYEATIDFTNTDGMVKPTSTVRSVGVVVGRRRGAISVPVDAVGKDTSGKPYVKVLDNSTWKPVVVELGMSDGNFVEIKSGVHEDDTVQVIAGQGEWLVGSDLTASE